MCNNCYISAELLDGYLDGSPPQQLIKQDNAHWPSFGVAFAFMGLVGTFAGMSVSYLISDKQPLNDRRRPNSEVQDFNLDGRNVL